jgi:hypothetical protein
MGEATIFMKKKIIAEAVMFAGICGMLASCNRGSQFKEWMTVGDAPTLTNTSVKVSLVDKDNKNLVQSHATTIFFRIKSSASDKYLEAKGSDDDSKNAIKNTHSFTDKIHNEYGITLKYDEITNKDSNWSYVYRNKIVYFDADKEKLNTEDDINASLNDKNNYTTNLNAYDIDIDFKKLFDVYQFKNGTDDDGNDIIVTFENYVNSTDFITEFQQAAYSNKAFTLANGDWITFDGQTKPADFSNGSELSVGEESSVESQSQDTSADASVSA